MGIPAEWEGVNLTGPGHGLERLGEVDIDNESWKFAIVSLWRHGQHVYGVFDYGCSCPTPFEDTKVGDLYYLGMSPNEVVASIKQTWCRSTKRPWAELREAFMGLLT